MIRRIFGIALVALLAMPLLVGASPADAARKTPRTMTRTFTASSGIGLPGTGEADPYPATIEVKGLKKGKITDVNVTLDGFTEGVPDDIDILLVAPDGRRAVIMSDVGGASGVNGIDLTLDDAAADSLPDSGPLASGSFRPTDIDNGSDDFPSPAPTAGGKSALSVFNGANPNGEWRLFIVDAPGNGAGSIDGWSLEITAQVKKRK
jgi:subtilisin-like proprotein convertase family protein